MDVNPGKAPYPGGPGHYPHQPQSSWFGRNWFWFVPLILVVLGSPFICCGGCFWFATGLIQAPVDAAVEAANDDPRVTDKLGTPIQKSDSSIVLGDFEVNNSSGSAELKPFAIDGPDGNATLSGDMKMENGVWSPKRLKVKFSDGSSIEIVE